MLSKIVQIKVLVPDESISGAIQPGVLLDRCAGELNCVQ